MERVQGYPALDAADGAAGDGGGGGDIGGSGGGGGEGTARQRTSNTVVPELKSPTGVVGTV